MKRIVQLSLCSLTALLAAAVDSAVVEPNAGGDMLTIYSTAQPGAIPAEVYRNTSRGQSIPGYAVVRQQRDIRLVQGRNDVRFSDVAAYIDPTTVMFESLTDPAGTRVLEQNFQFDLVSQDKLLQKYIDRPIKVDQIRGSGVESFSGVLLSTTGGMTLKRDDGTIELLPHNAGVTLPSLPGGLITRPTLVWDVQARQAANHRTRVSYQTTGATWWTDYNVTYNDGANANSCRLDIGAWVSIINQTGAGYQNAKLKLIAGDVQRATAVGRAVPMSAAVAKSRSEERDAFAEKTFFEYHLYTLGQPVNLPDNSTKQLELFPAAHNVACAKKLVYYGMPPGAYGYAASPMTDRNYGVSTNRKVDVYLSFANSTQNHMGMPLPSGRMRVSKLDDADRTLEFIGENVIDHTPANEKVLIKLGSAFDVVGERRQVDFKIDSSRKTMSEEIEIKLRNQKKESVVVTVRENLYRWTNWQIANSTHHFDKEDARTINFPVKLEAGAETTLRYTAHYSW